MRALFLAGLTVLLTLASFAQSKRVVVMGSSTAFGTGAQPETDSSWVRRVSHYYKYQNQVVDTIVNLARGGYDPYHGLPAWYTPAPGYNVPDPLRNITKATSFSPDIIMICFVSNNFNEGGLPTDSIMRVLQLLKDSANKAGSVCFISTTQPRSDFNLASRLRLKVLKDSIINRFGFYAVNLYDSLVNPVDWGIRPDCASPYDLVHLNNVGHRVIANLVIAKGIFNVSTTRTRKSGNWNDPLTWDKGIIPGENDSIAVQAGHTLVFNSQAHVRNLSVAAGATVILSNSATDVQIGKAENCRTALAINGTLQVNEGKLTVFGSLQQMPGSSFQMTGGELIINGNSGVELSSVADGYNLFDIAPETATFEFSGGTLQIVNPPFSATSEAIRCTFNFGENSTLKLGDGNSTIDCNQENGFGGFLLPEVIGRLVIDASGAGNNRVFRNMQPLTVKGLEVLSGRVIQSAPLTIGY